MKDRRGVSDRRMATEQQDEQRHDATGAAENGHATLAVAGDVEGLDRQSSDGALKLHPDSDAIARETQADATSISSSPPFSLPSDAEEEEED
eukprot:3027063-Rhodomonas_salina.1